METDLAAVKTNKINPLTDFNKKRKAEDRAMYGVILEAIHSQKSTPTHEAQELFKHIISHQVTLKRSGLLTLVLIDRVIYGTPLGSSTTAIGELLSLRIIHNNAEGIVAFLTKFRDLRGKLGSNFSATWSIEILRSRMLTEIGDGKQSSWSVASAAFARYDALAPEAPEEQDELSARAKGVTLHWYPT